MSIHLKTGLSIIICAVLLIACIASSGCVSEDNSDTNQIDETRQIAKDYLCNGIWIETPRSDLQVRYLGFSDDTVTCVKHLYGGNNGGNPQNYGGYPATYRTYNWKPNGVDSIIIYNDAGEDVVYFDSDNGLKITTNDRTYSFTKTPHQLSIDGIWMGDYKTTKDDGTEKKVMVLVYNWDLYCFGFTDGEGLLVDVRGIYLNSDSSYGYLQFPTCREYSVSGDTLVDIRYDDSDYFPDSGYSLANLRYDDTGNIIKEYTLKRVS